MIRIDCASRHEVRWIAALTVRLGLRIAGNGAYNVLVWCEDCDRWATGAVPLHVVARTGQTLDQLPVIADYRGTVGRCSRRGCDRDAVEDHHFAPWAIFGSEAEEWPRALLCREHHEEWHKRMGAA